MMIPDERRQLTKLMRWIDDSTEVVLYVSLYTENIMGIVISEGKMTQTQGVRMRGERGEGRKGGRKIGG